MKVDTIALAERKAKLLDVDESTYEDILDFVDTWEAAKEIWLEIDRQAREALLEV